MVMDMASGYCEYTATYIFYKFSVEHMYALLDIWHTNLRKKVGDTNLGKKKKHQMVLEIEGQDK